MFYSFNDVATLTSFAQESGQARVNLEKLNRMQQFCESTVCRRRILLSYFDEHDCHNCDVCSNPPERFDGSILAQMALSAIKRVNEQEGMTMIVDILKGSRKAELVMAGYHHLKTYGVGRDLTFRQWNAYMLQMLQLGLSYEESNHLKVTHYGMQVLMGKAQVMFSRFEARLPEQKHAKKERQQTIIPAKETVDKELFEQLRLTRSALARAQGVPPYLIFSDNRQYWTVFKPICDEFERRQIPLVYWTASDEDPGLKAEYKYVERKFIGKGNHAFAKLNIMSAGICLATTPGLDVLQWKRSKNVDWYVHILHAAGTSAAGYRMFSLDYYDAVLLTGDFQIDEIRELEAKRNLPPKELEVIGCTYMDAMWERLQKEEAEEAGAQTTDAQGADAQAAKAKETDAQAAGAQEADAQAAGAQAASQDLTVLLAPSWGTSSILCRYGRNFLDALAATGYKIIIRPHPQSFVSDKAVMDELQAAYPDSDQISWNRDSDNFEALRKADIMISDFSSVIFGEHL